jgi:acetolactate synthase-1/2/3 large subunit
LTIKLSDYIVNRLEEYDVKHLFMISGGGAMHLVDSVGRSKKVKYICPHHEQAAAIAAEGYARTAGKMGVVVVTSGPGGTNTLTGVIGQWLDSVPVLYLSGQVRFETTIASVPKLGLRQLGDQEINIVDLVKPVTKYAVMVRDPKTIRYHLERAIYLATHGRPGPVWLDIPLNVQSAMINEKKLKAYRPWQDKIRLNQRKLKRRVAKVIKLIKKAKRPVLIAGYGIRIAGAQKAILPLAKALKMPVLTTFNGFDLIPSDSPWYIGRIGTIGDRAGNFALQNADLIIELGSRNNIRQVSYNWGNFGRRAFKVVVDVDQAELRKPTVKPEFALNADLAVFLPELNRQLKGTRLPDRGAWLAWCRERKRKYPVVLPEYANLAKLVQPYYFIQQLTKPLNDRAIVVAGNGTACVVLFQAGIVKAGQRQFWNSGCASMGYDLPAAIGAAIAGHNRPVICLAGDGSLQMNIQELQTVFAHQLPIKLFVLNNQGYVSIKQTQDSFFGGHRVACCPATGVSCPDIIKLAKAYGLPTAVIDRHQGMAVKIQQIMSQPGPIVCEVKLETDYKFQPKLSSERQADGRLVSKPLEDMYPFLNPKELAANIIERRR